MTESAPGLRRVLEEELGLWPGRAGVAVLDETGVLAWAGDLTSSFPWASVTKVLTALTVLDVIRSGAVRLDEAAGPPGSTLEHLLAHASGIAFEGEKVMAEPGRRRIYSNRGIELAAAHVEKRTGRRFADSIRRRVLEPLGMSATSAEGSPAAGAHGPVEDLARLAAELVAPRVLPPDLVTQARTVRFPGLSGVLPGFGRQELNDWGLGLEVRGTKTPHWTAASTSPETFGHFGQAGSFLWVDPFRRVGSVGAGEVPFGPWAAEAWPRLSSRLLDELTSAE